MTIYIAAAMAGVEAQGKGKNRDGEILLNL